MCNLSSLRKSLRLRGVLTKAIPRALILIKGLFLRKVKGFGGL